MTKIKFGILGCAEIAMKNAAAIVDSPECELVGIASRDEMKAQMFRADCGLSEDVITYTYDDIIHEEWVDALYIPLLFFSWRLLGWYFPGTITMTGRGRGRILRDIVPLSVFPPRIMTLLRLGKDLRRACCPATRKRT